MARERRRLFISPDRLAPEIPLTAAEAHYLSRVLRLARGQGCDVVDGAGSRWGALLEGTDRLRLEQPLDQPIEQRPPLRPSLLLAVGLPKQEGELIWRMATELGLDQLQPLQAERCVTRGRWPQERWQAILREATEQSERLWLPQLRTPQAAGAWLACPTAGLKLLASSRRPKFPHLQGCLPSQAGPWPDQVCVAIGPEGGWSPAEEAAAQAQGWISVSLGPTILRTATAAVAAAAWLAGWRAWFSSSSAPGQSL
jgi:16S rRNA (uracil1498-N3)-methyltransferase